MRMLKIVSNNVLELAVRERDVVLAELVYVHVCAEVISFNRRFRTVTHLAPCRGVRLVDIFNNIFQSELSAND